MVFLHRQHITMEKSEKIAMKTWKQKTDKLKAIKWRGGGTKQNSSLSEIIRSIDHRIDNEIDSNRVKLNLIGLFSLHLEITHVKSEALNCFRGKPARNYKDWRGKIEKKQRKPLVSTRSTLDINNTYNQTNFKNETKNNECETKQNNWYIRKKIRQKFRKFCWFW